MTLIIPLVKIILEHEDNPLRFENFCMDIYKASLNKSHVRDVANIPNMGFI